MGIEPHLLIAVLFGCALASIWDGIMQNRGQELVKYLMLCGLSAVCFAAFTSVHLQVGGLLGEKGLIPISITLQKMKEFLASKKSPSWNTIRADSVMHYVILLTYEKYNFPSDQHTHLLRVTLIDIMLSIISMVYPHPILFLYLYFSYLAVKRIGGPFYNFQWDALLLEALLIATLLSMSYDSFTTSICMWLMKLLLFRLMFGSGAVKLFGKDPAWNKDYSAMSHHFLTQPLPSTLGMYMYNHLPKVMVPALTLFTLFAEVFLPALTLLNSRIINLVVAAFYIILQLGISGTGYYGK